MYDTHWVMGPGDGDSCPPLRAATASTFEALYRRHARRVRRIVSAIVSTPAEAEDVAQDVWLAVHRAFERGRVPSAAVPWLERLTREASHRHLVRSPEGLEVPLGLLPRGLCVAARPRADLELDLPRAA